MEKLRIMSVFGTRPEAIKMAPLVQELQRRYEEKYGKTIAIPALYQSLLELCAQGYAGQAGGGSFVKILKS